MAHLQGHQKVVQMMGEEAFLFNEARLGVEGGATTVFVDTGVPADIKPFVDAFDALGVRERVTVAFAGRV